MDCLNRRLLYSVLVIFLGSNLLSCEGKSPGSSNTGATTLAISATTPANGATDVSTSSALTVTFNEPVDPTTVTLSTILFNPPVTGAITVTGTTAMFAPSTPLAPSTRYTVTLTTGIKDLAGNALTSIFAWSFTTSVAPDLTPPTVSATSPTNDATNVSTSSALTVTFNEPVDPTTVTLSTILINPPVTGAITVTGTTAMFAPSTPLAPSTSYTVTLTTGIKDLAGNALTSIFAWSFTTSAAPDLTPPTVSATSPTNGATNVSTSSALTVTFNEPVNPATVTATTFTLKDSATNPVTGNITTSGVTVTFAFPPGTPLASNTRYTAMLTPGITDLAGNALTSTFAWSFTTIGGSSPTFGLDFPTNAAVADGNTVRFKFTNPHLNGLPIYGPGGAGLTYIFKVRPKQQTGYYTTFFWANDDGAGDLSTFGWDGGGANTYYGMHPYPPGSSSGTTHNWEISVEASDYQNGLVIKDAWYTQVVRVWSDGSGKHHEFYWDWPNTDAAHKVTRTSPTSWGNTNPPSPALTFGDAPWQPGREMCSCTLRGLQIYNSLLSLADIQAEMAAPLSTPAGATSVWYLNLDPTPSDISDKSGKGHHPAWVGTGRPTLYLGP